MPSDLITSTMKSDPERFSVRTSSMAGVPASSSFGMGCAVPARETSDCFAFATAGIAASAAAPAAAPFRNLRRSISFFLDFLIVVSVALAGRFYAYQWFFRLNCHLMPGEYQCQDALRFQ